MRARRALLLGGAALLLVCCGTWGRTIWPPVSRDAVCGRYESEGGAVVILDGDGRSSVERIAFGHDSNGDLLTLSGSGVWELERSVTARGEVAFELIDANVEFELSIWRDWRGDVSLWQYLDDPDSGERETFIRKSDCG